MTAMQLLADLRQRGIKLAAHDGRLRFHPKAAVGPQLLLTLRRHKAELLALLLGEPLTCRRCGTAGILEVLIHGGRSVRRDCAQCGRFVEFPIWYGRSVKVTGNCKWSSCRFRSK
jgi:hypothetical protein